MKSISLLYVSLVLFRVALLAASRPILDAEHGSHLRSLSHHPDGDASQRVLLQDDPDAVQPSAAESAQDGSCSVASNILRPGNTYNDPSALRLEDASACCHACQQEDRCLAWSYDSRTGACALKDKISRPYSTSSSDEGRFLSSGGDDISESGRSRYPSVSGATAHRGSPYGAAAQGAIDHRARAAYNACVAETGVAYPGGSVLRETTTGSHKDCCELCRRDTECFSWHRNANSSRCVLNKDTPRKVQRGKHFAGATVI